MHAVDARTGKPLFSLNFKQWPMFSSPAVAGRRLYIGSHAGTLIAIDLDRHTPAWTFRTDGAVQNSATYTKKSGAPNYEAAFADFFYDDLMIGVWRMMSVGAVLSSPVVAENVVYFGSTDGTLYALRLTREAAFGRETARGSCLARSHPVQRALSLGSSRPALIGPYVNILGRMAHGVRGLRAWRDQRQDLPCRAAGASGRGLRRSSRSSPMESFLVSLSTVAIAEMGDRTQLLSLMLAAHYRRPWPILAGILSRPSPIMLVAGLDRRARWSLPHADAARCRGRRQHDRHGALDSEARQAGGEILPSARKSAFVATLIAFFIAEIGDKTQIATIALAAAYSNLFTVVAGTTTGMLLANAPVVFLGEAFAERLPIKAIHYVASAVFVVLGVIFIVRAVQHAT